MKKCVDCNGKCCKYVAVEIDEPETKEDWEEIRWFLCHENVVVYKDNDGDWLVELRTKCKYLGENNKCGIYDNRPQKCMEHDIESCELNGDGDIGDPLFKSVEELEEYLKKQKKKWAEM